MRHSGITILFIYTFIYLSIAKPVAATPSSHSLLETKASSIRSELLRIFRIPNDQLKNLPLSVVKRSELHSKNNVNFSAMYVGRKIYISEDLLNSPQLEFSLRHEITHWIVDRLSNGRCPAWLDEGLAQILSGPASNKIKLTKADKNSLKRLSLRQLETNFSQLQESELLLAYTRSRLATRSLIFRRKFPKIREFLIDLGAGKQLPTAFVDSFGLTLEEFDKSSIK